jgi:hypothetical protein
MAFSLLDPEAKKVQKTIREQERDFLIKKLTGELHIMKTKNVKCFCDRCEIVREIINKVV